MHHSHIKLFLDNQPPLHTKSCKLKLKSLNAYRLRTDNITEQVSDTSGRPCNLPSFEMPNPLSPAKVARNDVLEKVKKRTSGSEKLKISKAQLEERQIQAQHSKFKTAFTNREPLRFLKPELRYRNVSETTISKKTSIYRQIAKIDFSGIQEKKSTMIEYSTQYCPSMENRRDNVNKQHNSKSARFSMNVLRSKLRKHFRH